MYGIIFFSSIDKLTSIIASLNEGTTYYIRVRHNGKKYESSDWCSTFKVSTLEPVTPVHSELNFLFLVWLKGSDLGLNINSIRFLLKFL